MKTGNIQETQNSFHKSNDLPEKRILGCRNVAFPVSLIFFAFFTSIVVLHYQGFHAPMVYDSSAWILNQAPVFEQHHLPDILGLMPARPLFIASLYANFLLTGMEPSYFRWTNAAVLAGVSVIFMLLLTLIFRVAALTSTHFSDQTRISLFLALLFAVHPLQSFVVLYIWQREALMGCMFFLSALTAYLAGRSGMLGSRVAYGLTGILFFGGMLSKENVVTLPFILLLVEIILLKQHGKDLRMRTANITIATGLPFAVYLLLNHILGKAQSVHTTAIIQRLTEYYFEAGIGPMEAAFTQARVLFSYLWNIVAPPLNGMPLLKAEVVSRSLWNPLVTIAAVTAFFGLIATGIGLARKRPVVSFGILFFIIVSLPEALCIPQYPFCAYRAILPMVGVLIVLGDCLLRLIPKIRIRSSRRGFAFAALCIAFLPTAYLSVSTVGQAARWNPVRFWQNQYECLPPLSKDVAYRPYGDILANYAQELLESGQHDKAVAVLKQAASLVEVMDSAWKKPGIHQPSKMIDKRGNTNVQLNK